MAKYTSEPFGVKEVADLQRPEKDQFASTYDILSEGPIEGLANGMSSIFINDVPLIQEQAENILKPRRFKANVTASSSTITHAQFGEIDALEFQNKTGLDLGTRRIAIEKAGASGSGIASATAETKTVTTSTGYFTSAMLAAHRQTRVPIYLRIAGAGPNGTTLRTKVISVNSATNATIADAVATTVSNVDIFFDYLGTCSSISSNTVTLSGTAPTTTVNSASIQVSSPLLEGLNLSELWNFKDVEIGFRTGQFNSPTLAPSDNQGTSTLFTPNIKLEQANLRDVIGTTGNLAEDYNDELDEPSQSEGTSADTVLTAAAMGVTSPAEVDEIHVTFNFPQSHAIKSSGAKGASFVEHQIFFEYSTDNGSSFTSELAFGPSNDDILTRTTGSGGKNVNHPVAGGQGFIPNNGYVKPNPAQFTSFIEEFKIDTAEFQPFDTYRIRVRRITDLNFKDNSFQHTNPSILQSVENIVKDKLYHPYTSYAKVAFNAKDFDSKMPVRSYLLKGRKVKVPTNYFTRDENSGAATYTRNVSSGATESTYQSWDGNFRGDTTTFNESSVNFDEVYTDNPVWIFYDLLTNNRYGLGQFIDPDQIDKYELFRLARFCDEEVDDGEGGTEPRFTCNVYINKSSEATNLLRQFASVFRGMALWMDGQITAISDRPQKPIYTFTKANVKQGAFTYEGTGQKVKVNQVKVTWNDPTDNYRQSIEYVEDTEALISNATAKPPRLIRKDILAFGTTSRGQAHRLGKWKLISDHTETETVSFVTGPNAIGLKPGDVIAVQDADRDRASYSGRVSNTGTRNTTTIPIDRDVVIPAYSSSFPPQLLLIYPSGGAYLNQDSATISSATYSKGDLIPSVSTSAAAANLVDDSNNHVDVYWSENARIETKTVSSPGTSGATVSSLTVSSAFSAVPDAEVMWSLRIFNTNGTEATGTVKEYKVISIKETAEQEFEVVAGEYNINKFDKIERGYVLDPRPSDDFPNPEDEVPAPLHITSKLSPSESAEESTTQSNFNVGHDLSIDWDYPENSDGTRYGYVSGFEVTHNFRGKPKTERVGTEEQGFTINNVTGGTYFVEIRTISSINTFSLPTKRNIQFAAQHFTTPTAPIKQGRVPKGGLISAPLSIDSSTGNASINAKSSSGGSFNFTNANGEVKTISNSNTAMYNTSTTLAAGNQGDATYQLLVDDSATALKYVDERTDTSASPSFTYFKLASSSTGLTTRTGTVTVEKGSNKVTGTNTTFETHYEPGDTFHIDNGSSTTRTTGGTSSNSTTVTLSSSNSDIKVGQTVTGSFFGTDEATYTNLGGSTVKTSAGEVFVTAISGTTLTVSTPITVANGVTLTFTPRTVYGTVSEVVSQTLMFLDEAVERKYEGALHKELEFKPDTIKDTIIADVRRATVLGSTVYSLVNEYVDYPVAEESLTFDRIDPDVIITQSDAIASNDNETTIPTSAAVKDYVDNASKSLANVVNLTMTGDLTVGGTTTTINTATLDVEDKNITLNKGSGDTSSNADGAGITIQDAVDASNDATMNWVAANDRFRFSHGLEVNSGSVGIGTTSPTAKLHIHNTSTTSDGDGSADESPTGQDSILLYGHGGTNGQTYGGITWLGSSSRRRAMISAVAENTDTDYVGLAFYTQGTDGSGDFYESMRIARSGNVGIGTTSPDTTSRLTLIHPSGTNGRLISLYRSAGAYGFHLGVDSNSQFNIYDNNGTSSLMAIAPTTGNVAIGTTTTTNDAKLIVNSGDGKHPCIKVSDGGSNGFTMLADNYTATESNCNIGSSYSGADFVLSASVKVSDAADDTYLSSQAQFSAKPTAIRIQQDGIIKFLTASSSATTSVDSAVTLTERARITDAGLAVTGAITATGDVTAFSSSDKRLKTNIIKIDSALNKVSQISGYHFEWKKMEEAPHQGKDIGVIAQEIEKVLPEIVVERDTGYKAVNYQKLTALLIEAVKELKEEINELKGNK